MIGYMAQSAQATGIDPVDGLLLLLGGGVFFALPGCLAYAGKWRRWTRDYHGRTLPYFPFGLAWMGAGAVLLGLFCVVSALGGIAVVVAAIVLGVPGIAVFCCGLVFLLWTPRFLLPPWYREFRQLSRGPR